MYIALHTCDVWGGADRNVTCHTMGIQWSAVKTILLNILYLQLFVIKIITKSCIKPVAVFNADIS